MNLRTELLSLIRLFGDAPFGRLTHRLIRNAGVVEENSWLAIATTLISKGEFRARYFARGGAGKIVCAHRKRDVIVNVNFVVVEYDLLPAFASVDGEPQILAAELF